VTKTVNRLAARLRSSTPAELQRSSNSLGGLGVGRKWRNGRECDQTADVRGYDPSNSLSYELRFL